MSRGKKLNLLISTLLLALFLYLAFRNVNFEELGRILKTTNYFYVFIGVFVGVVGGSIVRAFRWGVLLEPVKKDIPFKSLFATTIIGYMVNNLGDAGPNRVEVGASSEEAGTMRRILDRV